LKRIVAAIGLLTAFAVFLFSTSDRAPHASGDIIWISMDTTRADHLGFYGYPRNTTPHLDRLADESLVFDQMLVPMATTLPTHTSILTGTMPYEHGILANVEHGGRRFVPSENIRTLTEVLKDAGYRTAGFVSAAPLREFTGIAAGFDHYDEPSGHERVASGTVNAVLDWLPGRSDKPMFLWVHVFDPHNPYRPHPAYKDELSPDKALHDFLQERETYESATRPSGQVIRAVPANSRYDGEIRYMDEQLNRLLRALRDQGMLDNALLVMTGDHGEGLNQHGEPGHGQVWLEQVRAPFLIHHPRVSPGRHAEPVAAVDVFPTALQFLDRKIPGLDAWLEQASGQNALKNRSPRHITSQTSSRQESYGRAPRHALRVDNIRCVLEGDDQATLYNLEADPFELSPINDGPELEACIVALKEEIAAQKARGADFGSGEMAPMDPAMVEQLEALGYMLKDDDEPAEGSPKTQEP